MRKIELHWQILVAIIIGIAFGKLAPSWIVWIDWLGILFLKALKMIVLPLIIASVINGVVGLGSGNQFGRLGIKVMAYYFTTTILAILTGLFFVNLIEPGNGADLGLASAIPEAGTGTRSFSDILMGIVPSNLFQSMANGEILPVIFFSLLFGYFITRIKDEKRNFLQQFFDSAYDVIMKLTMLIIRFAPLGIFSIVAVEVAKNSDRLMDVAGSMGLYMLVVIAGLLCHALITLPLIVRIIGKAKPFVHLRNMMSALLTAFSTSSSSATLPLTIESTVNKSGVSPSVSSFTLPLGATVNMDGTALYECVAAVFIAQAYGIELSFGQQLIVVATSLLASIGAAGIPMAGLVMLSIILSAVNLPLEGLGLILAVDRILDMIRTTVNVWSDSCGAVVIAKSEGEKLNV
jgi:Na+/H+-dicarboxylate symporter